MKREYHIPRSKIRLVPNGIPQTSLASVSASELQKMQKKFGLEHKRVLSYLGRIQKYKGIDQVVRALPVIAKKHPDVLFVAIGKDVGDQQRLEALARSLNVTQYIVFTGEVTEQEKLALLDCSEIFLFPSEWEAFGIATLEAMARGNAVVSSTTEGSLFLIQPRKNGLLFEYGDVKELGKKVLTLLENEKLRETMQHNNRLKAQTFLWENIAKDLEAVYREIR